MVFLENKNMRTSKPIHFIPGSQTSVPFLCISPKITVVLFLSRNKNEMPSPAGTDLLKGLATVCWHVWNDCETLILLYLADHLVLFFIFIATGWLSPGWSSRTNNESQFITQTPNNEFRENTVSFYCMWGTYSGWCTWKFASINMQHQNTINLTDIQSYWCPMSES